MNVNEVYLWGWWEELWYCPFCGHRFEGPEIGVVDRCDHVLYAISEGEFVFREPRFDKTEGFPTWWAEEELFLRAPTLAAMKTFLKRFRNHIEFQIATPNDVIRIGLVSEPFGEANAHK